MLKLIIIVCLIAQGFSAEEFILTDGRHLTGTYDTDSATLYLDAAKKMAIHITADQIVERKAVAVQEDKPDAPESMTKEEKAKALNAYKRSQQDADKQKMLTDADKKDKEAEDCLKKADAAKEKIHICCESFQARAVAEHYGCSIDSIKEEKICLPKTNANNGDILALVAWEKKMRQQAKDCTAAAKALREKVNPPAAPAAAPAPQIPAVPVGFPGIPGPVPGGFPAPQPR